MDWEKGTRIEAAMDRDEDTHIDKRIQQNGMITLLTMHDHAKTEKHDNNLTIERYGTMHVHAQVSMIMLLHNNTLIQIQFYLFSYKQHNIVMDYYQLN